MAVTAGWDEEQPASRAAAMAAAAAKRFIGAMLAVILPSGTA